MAKKAPIRYRLGIDLGSNSLGWAVLRLDTEDKPDYLVRIGTRIFSDGRKPKDGASLAVDRRMARQQRRRRDRFLRRKARLLDLLRTLRLFPPPGEAAPGRGDVARLWCSRAGFRVEFFASRALDGSPALRDRFSSGEPWNTPFDICRFGDSEARVQRSSDH